MADAEEDCFPRGGRRVNDSSKRPKEDDNLFSGKIQRKAKKPRKEKKKGPVETLTEEAFHSALKIHGNLSYQSLRSDMLILGCIRHITNFSMEVELPGLTFGKINIMNISDPFTKHLNECLERSEDGTELILKKMFQVGQFIMVKVVQIEHKEGNVHVDCTMNPKEIYSERSHTYFKKGMLVWASVQAVLDHGYELNIGVKNCRVFLPSKNVDEDKKLAIGVPLWCIIHKCDVSTAATTIRVSCKETHMKSLKIEEISSLDNLIPGMQVEMLTEKITSNGIEGKVLNDYFGFIDGSQLKTPLKCLENYEEGKLITVFVMYVDHATKVTHLTMRNMDAVSAPGYSNGKILSGDVVSRAHNGIYLKLPSGEKSFVTNNRLMNSLGKKPNLDLSDTIRTKFSIGTKHTCRILDYNRLSRLYIATVEQTVIKEKIFTSTDLALGQLVDIVMESVGPEGVVVSVGQTRGFVPNLYISNVKYSETIKKRLKEGYKCKARVLDIEGDKVLLTLKQGQVEAENNLTDINNAKRGDKYTGVVVLTRPTGALVKFYGPIRGWISAKFLEDQESHEKPDPLQYFYEGQVVNFWVLGVKNERLILSLKQPREFVAAVDLKVGTKVRGVVSKIYEDRLEVKTKRGKALGVSVSTFETSEAVSDCITWGKVGNDLIGMSKKLFLTLDKTKAIIARKKASRKENHSSNSTENTTELTFSSSYNDSNTANDIEYSDDEGNSSNDSAVELNAENLQQGNGVKRKANGKAVKNSGAGLTGISSLFFQPDLRVEDETSSDEEEEANTVKKKKKKKLSAKERAVLASQEEERISKIENDLANIGSSPQNADQFDRVLLANPNSSELWTKYIAFHTAATEFGKAKAVAKRALESIQLTLTDERFNIWLVLLNLENMFGTKEGFDQTFEEAVCHNDSLQVYLKVVQMLADAGKLSDMEEKAKKCRNKHKQEPSMWLELAKTYYSIGRFKDARNLKDAALKSIQDKKTQMEMIVRFAIMEYKFGEEEQGAAVFETILNSDPKKVNIWTTYVDQLIKRNRMENARRVLERSVCQRLPLKCMRTLFAKFRMFEEQYGTPESLEAVKERAKEFVDQFGNKN